MSYFQIISKIYLHILCKNREASKLAVDTFYYELIYVDQIENWSNSEIVYVQEYIDKVANEK